MHIVKITKHSLGSLIEEFYTGSRKSSYLPLFYKPCYPCKEPRDTQPSHKLESIDITKA